MLPPNAPIAARHARMFEFLRQSQQAEMTAARLSDPASCRVTRQSLEEWCAQAIQSLGVDATT